MEEDMTLEEWKQKNRYSKCYVHFDKRVLLDNTFNYISNPKRVARHAFYPFITYQKREIRYIEGDGRQEPKYRKICYAAHLDNKIYQYYSFLINKIYTHRAIADNIDRCVIAYRDNMNGQTNIHFAKRAFDFIKGQSSCYIMIGDFKGYFDNLHHRYLKRMLCDLLETNTLTDDYYNVYKSITAYGEWERDKLLSFHKLCARRKHLREFNEMDTVLSYEEFKSQSKKKGMIEKNTTGKGIPQGSAISAVFANVYLLHFDKAIADLVDSYNGLYMRYSDDFIIVIPTESKEVFQGIYERIKIEICNIPELIVEEHKTQLYHYMAGEILSCNNDFISNSTNSRNFLDYLGFTFDGESVDFRAKTLTRYYKRMNKKVYGIIKSKGITKKKNRISGKNLYNKYSISGAYPKEPNKHGNFLTYVCRAEGVFSDEPKIAMVRKRHMHKIRRSLNKPLEKW